MTLKRAIGKIHLWLGLASGLVVFIVSITGCLFAFQTEISKAIHRKELFITTPVHTQTLSMSSLIHHAEKALGDSVKVNYITAYKDSGRAWEFMAYKENDKALTYFSSFDYYCSAFLNPYTGEITGIKNYKTDFFNLVKYVHCTLFLNPEIGTAIVGWSTFIFVILLITGLVLWWPNKWNKITKQQSFTIKWKARYKRFNYDLHNVFGFYTLALAIVLALTGMVYAFGWFASAVYVVVSGTTTLPEETKVVSVKPQDGTTVNAIDVAFGQSRKLYPMADRIGIGTAADAEGPLYISAYRGQEIYYNRDDMEFDQYSGKLLHTKFFSKSNNGEKLYAMNYDIHVGAIGGIIGKIIAFIVSLVCASLPVTGFLIWWWKRKESGFSKLMVQ